MVPKKGGSLRPIINLKALNCYVITLHFKLETIQNLKDVLHQGDFMRLDLKDAYQTVPVYKSWKYLRFMWKGKAYEFTTLPFRLVPAPLILLTKLLKPVLRQIGVRMYDLPRQHSDHGDLPRRKIQEPPHGSP